MRARKRRTHTPKALLVCVSALLGASAGSATAADTYPLKLPASGGEVILPDAAAKQGHDQYRYSAARRVGDMVYISGVAAYRGQGEG